MQADGINVDRHHGEYVGHYGLRSMLRFKDKPKSPVAYHLNFPLHSHFTSLSLASYMFPVKPRTTSKNSFSFYFTLNCSHDTT